MSVSPDPFASAPSGSPPALAAGAAVIPPLGLNKKGSMLAGERILDEYKRQGYELYLMAGISGVGKTQLLDAYQKSSPYLPLIERNATRPASVMPTAQRSFACYPVKAGTRKAVFVDASGEDFRLLYPLQRAARTLPEADARLLKVAADALKGLVLVIDLERLWGKPREGGTEDPADRHQERILAWVLELLRWFYFGGQYDAENAAPFQEQVTARVQRMSQRQRLPFPVQVVFSKADRLTAVSLPARSPSIWARDTSKTRTIFPPGDHPLLLAYHYLPLLYEALRENVRVFRFDFAHSIATSLDSGAAVDETPCGVEYTLSWLMERRWGPELGTGTWVRLQRRLDILTFRGRRWRRLPEPRELHDG